MTGTGTESAAPNRIASHTVSHDQTTKKNRSYTPVSVPKVMSVPFFATALFAYEAVEGSELSVSAGEFLTIEEVNESGWCLVRRTHHTHTHDTHISRAHMYTRSTCGYAASRLRIRSDHPLSLLFLSTLLLFRLGS